MPRFSRCFHLVIPAALTLAGCYTTGAATPPTISSNARLHLVFRTPIDVAVTGSDQAPDTLRGVKSLQGRYNRSEGDTVILRELSYVVRSGVNRRAPRDAEFRYVKSAERVGTEGELQELRFSPGRTLAAVTLPVLIPLGLLLLLLSVAAPV